MYHLQGEVQAFVLQKVSDMAVQSSEGKLLSSNVHASTGQRPFTVSHCCRTDVQQPECPRTDVFAALLQAFAHYCWTLTNE